MEDKQTQIRLLYRDIATTLRVKYNPHFNLYQKQQLFEKIQCYKQSQDKPEVYYQCIVGIDEKMAANSQMLQKRFGAIEVNDKECQEKCEQYNLDGNAKQACLMKCMETMKEQCFKLQDHFYETMLKSNPEYKSIK